MTSKNPIDYIQWTAFDDSMNLAIFRGDEHQTYQCYEFGGDYNVIERLARMNFIARRFMNKTARNIRRIARSENA